MAFFQPVATPLVRFASRFLLANRRLKFITDPTPKRGPSNVQSVTEVFQLRQVVLLICKQTNKQISTSQKLQFFVSFLLKARNVKSSILFENPPLFFFTFFFTFLILKSIFCLSRTSLSFLHLFHIRFVSLIFSFSFSLNQNYFKFKKAELFPSISFEGGTSLSPSQKQTLNLCFIFNHISIKKHKNKNVIFFLFQSFRVT